MPRHKPTIQKTNILIFDLSNLIFYRYYALKKYFTLQKKSIENNNDEFKNHFIQFDKFINKLINKLKLKHDINHIIFLKDCRRKDIWRNNILSSYKQNRPNNTEIGEYFKYAYEHYFENEDNNINICSTDNAEADDICSILIDYLIDNKQQINYDDIYIFTSDQDYLQLIKTEYIHVYDNKLNNLANKSMGNYILDLKYKCIIGDKSDNIPPIMKLSKNTALKYLNDNELFNKLLTMKPEVEKQYQINCSLINLNNIPENIKTNILSKIKLLF